MAATEGRITALFRDLAAGIAGDVARLADSAGAVPRSATPEIQRLSAERVARLFLGRNRAGELAPFEVATNGRVVALAPYPEALWAGIAAAVRLPIEQSAGILEKYAPADVLATLRQAKGNPFTAAKRRVVEEMAPVRGGALVAEFTQIELFQPNVLAAYDPPHLWVDPNGYRLSDRVWDNSQAVRQKIDLYVADAIKQGIGATEMAKGLEQFLTPGYGQIKTKKPYGTTASYGAMRLARTEITRAHMEAQRVSAASNPFIQALKWNLSASHPRIDICDDYARGGPNRDGVYPIDELPSLPHPHCLCFRTNVMAPDPDAVIEALRRDVRQARADLVGLIGPAAVEDFEMLLLGGQGPLSAPTPAGTVRRVTPPPPPPPPATPAAPPPMAGLDDPTMTLVWGKDPEGQGQALNGVAFEPVENTEYWLGWKDKKFKDEPALPTGQRISTGVVIVEPDGRIWIVEPAGHYGGYEHTFPKGGLEPNLSPQQNALKELYEESGLTAELTGYLGDFQGSTGVSRYYIARRTGGAPWRSDWETATVKLAPQDKAAQLLNTKRDKEILATLQAKLAPKPKKPRAPRKPKPAPPAATPAPLPASAGDEIPGLDQLAFVKKLGGSTGAQLFEDKAGKRYVVKGGNSEEHIRSEYLADELYRALGANVPRARLVQKGGKTYKIAEYIEGKLLNELSGKALANAHAELQKHFASDALLASWDVIGLGADNVIVDAAGAVWRIDNGGSLLFRAQGAPKAMGNYLDELWTLRDKAVNAQTHKVFGNAGYGDIANQLSAIVSQRSVIMSKVTDPDLRRILDARLNHAADLAGIYRTFHDDNYIDSYIDRFSYHNTWIQAVGVTSTLPQRLTQQSATSSNVILIDESGKEFDDLRGRGGIYARFLKELDARTGKKGKEFIRRWADAQAGDSWSPLSRLVKQRMMVNRPSSSYYWKDTDSYMESALAHFRTLYSDDAVTDMAAALNALSYETLRRVEVGKRPAPGVLTLLRTESDFVLDRYGMQRKKGSRATIERGALESTSLLKPVVVMGGNLTEQDIPIHRVMGFYGFGTDKTMYLNDRENELLVLLDGYESRYARKVNR